MLKQEEIYAKSIDNIERNLWEKNCDDEALFIIDRSLDYNRVVLLEPSDEEIVQYLRSL